MILKCVIYITIPKKNKDLNISTHTTEHAIYYRDSQRPGGEIIEFEVPKWFDDFVKETQIPQAKYKTSPFSQGGTAPKRVDPNKPGIAYELPPPWVEWIEEYAQNAKILE